MDNINIIRVVEIPSTQKYCINTPLPTNSIIFADFQTEGVGQYGNNWHDYRDTQFICSFVINKQCVAPALYLQYFAYAIYEYLSVWVNLLKLSIKWPNDIYLGNKKIGGMLLNVKDDQWIVGIGINIYKTPIKNASYITNDIHYRDKIINYLQNKIISIVKEPMKIKVPIIKIVDTQYYINSQVIYKDEIFNINSIDEETGELIISNENQIIAISESRQISYVKCEIF